MLKVCTPSSHLFYIWSWRSVQNWNHFLKGVCPPIYKYFKSVGATNSFSDAWSLHSLREIEIRYDGREGGSFPEEALLPPSLIRLNITFPHLTSLNGRGFQHLTLLKQLEIWVCKNLQRLPEEGFPASLSILDIWQCPLLKKRYRRKNGKEWRKISQIPIIRIDFEAIT